MTLPIIELIIHKGKTLDHALLYADGELEFRAIAGVVSYAPVVLTVPAHGLKDDWPITISNVRQPYQLNTGGLDLLACDSAPRPTHYMVRVVDEDTVRLINVNGSDWKAYTAGGVVAFYPPADLTGYEARAHVRRRVSDTDTLVSFASPGLDAADGTIEVNVEESSITLVLDAAIAAQLKAGTAVWDAELVAADGDVRPLVGISPCSITDEVTR